MSDTRTCRFQVCKTKARGCTEYTCVRDGSMMILTAFRCAHCSTHLVLPRINRFEMHFLCLHGKSSNTKIFQAQLSAIEYQLGDGHTYHFVEGTIPENTQRDLFSYVVQDDPHTWNTALDDLDRYLNLEGPFDGVIGVSQGAALVATFLASGILGRTQRRGLKVAILFSSEAVVDPIALPYGVVQTLKQSHNHEVVDIASAHFRASADTDLCIRSEQARQLFRQESRWELTYEGGPGMPKTMDRTLANQIAQIIRRAVYSSGYEF